MFDQCLTDRPCNQLLPMQQPQRLAMSARQASRLDAAAVHPEGYYVQEDQAGGGV